jgi:hypothetical protein
MKRITDGMDAELRTEGLKGAKNKLFSKVKAGSALAGKDLLQLSIANTVQAVWQYQMVLVQELWLELLLRRFCG